jgi:hypothetical protein
VVAFVIKNEGVGIRRARLHFNAPSQGRSKAKVFITQK